MINLLPDTNKHEIRAARTNILLMRYIVIMFVAIVVLAGLLIGAYIVLNNARNDAQVKVNENEQRVADYKNVKAKADAFRTDLTTAKSILNSDVSYTKLIYRIASITPPNVVLDSLNLDPKTFGSSATMSASAKTFADATKLKDAFIRSDDIFTNVQLQTIKTGDSATIGDEYPVKVVLSVVINKDALR
jgi:Tfp pilus assembly protein PilN